MTPKHAARGLAKDVKARLCAPEGQTVGMGNTETRAPSEGGLDSSEVEHQYLSVSGN